MSVRPFLPASVVPFQLELVRHHLHHVVHPRVTLAHNHVSGGCVTTPIHQGVFVYR